MTFERAGLAGSNSTPQMGMYPAWLAPTSAKPPPEKREAIVRVGFCMVGLNTKKSRTSNVSALVR